MHAFVVQGGPIEPPADDITMPARAPSAAACVMVACAARIRPYVMMPYSKRDQEHHDEGELDHFSPVLVVAPPPQRSRNSPRAHLPTWDPLLCFSAAAPRSTTNDQLFVARFVRVDCGARGVRRYIGHMDHLRPSPGTLVRRMVRRTYVRRTLPVVPSNASQRRDRRVTSHRTLSGC